MGVPQQARRFGGCLMLTSTCRRCGTVAEAPFEDVARGDGSMACPRCGALLPLDLDDMRLVAGGLEAQRAGRLAPWLALHESDRATPADISRARRAR